MNSVRFHYAVALAGAFVVAAYILFGDSFILTKPPKRKKRRKGIVPGLVNIGNSCFLNCILQALASCTSFREWLEQQDFYSHDTSLVCSLRKKMIVLCNEVEESDLDAMDIFRALRKHGWVISSQEQDAHELFHALTSTIDDELGMIKQEANSLFNVRWLVDTPHRSDSNNVQDAASMRMTLDQPLPNNDSDTLVIQDVSHQENQNSFEERFVGFYKSSSIITKVPFSLKERLMFGNDSLLSDSPFKGHLASQLQCTICGVKNAEQWSSFESISLSLPGIGTSTFSLQELLYSFIRPECVSDVTCDSCTKVKGVKCKTTFTKQMTVGKLPDCLCMHIQRTVWLGNGYPFKRRDHILFPEVLNMDPYTYAVSLECQGLKGKLLGGSQVKNDGQQATTSCSGKENIGLPLMHSLTAYCSHNNLSSNASLSHLKPSIGHNKSKGTALYKLQAVVVHVGDVLTGHFVTYRRGSIETCSTDRWFYTSDLVVREVSLDEVLSSNAYMILYERSIL